MSVKSLVLTASLATVSSFYTASSLADSKVVREYSFDVTKIHELEIHASVGSIDIIPGSGTELKLVLEIEGDQHGWFKRDKDVSEVELSSRMRGDRLILDQSENNTNTQWTIELPAIARTDIHMGVGSIKAGFAATQLQIELGVGEIDIDYPKAAAGYIELSVGVGEATLRGTEDVTTTKAFVSHAVNGYGDGAQDIDIHLGVGDVDVRLR